MGMSSFLSCDVTLPGSAHPLRRDTAELHSFRLSGRGPRRQTTAHCTYPRSSSAAHQVGPSPITGPRDGA